MEGYGSVIGSKVILSILSIILLFPCFMAVRGIYFALTVDSPTSHEGFILAGLLAINSVIIWLPYLIYLYISRKDTSKQFKLICSIPFFILVFCFFIAL